MTFPSVSVLVFFDQLDVLVVVVREELTILYLDCLELNFCAKSLADTV